MRTALVKLLTRPGCEACTRGIFILKRLKLHVPFQGKVVNIMKEKEYLIYQNELPVVLVEEVPVCRTRIVERDIRRAVEEFNRRP